MKKTVAIPYALSKELAEITGNIDSLREVGIGKKKIADLIARQKEIEDKIAAEYGEQPMTSEEIAERNLEEAEHASRKAEVTALEKIARLEEKITPRRLREAILGDGGWLAEIDAKIASERSIISGDA